MERNYTGKDLVGAKVKALGFTFEIAKVMYAEYWDREGYDIEFLDPKGGYHHWKQWDDGGEIIFPKKKLVNCYGSDCTDLFRKYGYNV